MTKPLHSGLAARGALTAWRLAASGFTAAPDAMEAKSGFFAAYGVAESDPALTVAGLGRPFVIDNPGLALKKFPCCYASHRAIDGLLTLRAKLGADAASVEKVVCRMPPGGMQVLTYPRPATGLEGKFSLHYPLAAALLDGTCTLASFSDEAVRRPAIAQLYDRIEAKEDAACRGDDPQFDKLSSGSRGFVEVEIHLRGGRSDRIRIDKPPGAPSRALTWDDLEAKFSDCAREAPKLSSANAEAAWGALTTFEKIEDVRTFIDLLR
jgi:2-methylcitrate dehydratase PrpD